MSWAEQLPQYVENLRGLLRSDEVRYSMVVERQIQAQLLRKMTGLRVALEPHLWSLLILCLDGHEAPVPGLDDALWQRAEQAATKGTSLAGSSAARFPAAARALANAIDELRKYGIYPRPLLSK